MVDCPSCHQPIPDSAIRQRRQRAICPTCDVVVKLARADGGWAVVGTTIPGPPEGLKVEWDEPPEQLDEGYRADGWSPGRFRASRRWWSPTILFLTVFACVWDGFLIFWYAMALSSGQAFPAFFALGHVAVGIGLTWFVVASWLNTTTVDVRDGVVTCESGPVPLPFTRTEPVELSEVEVFDTEPTKGSRRTGASRSFNLVARMEDGRRVAVAKRVGDERIAKYLRQRLEAQLR